MKDSDGIRGWLDDVRAMRDNEEADSCQWPGCDGPFDVLISAAAAGGATLKVHPHGGLELVQHGREGAACGVHALTILTRLPGEEILSVKVYSDPDDPEECEPAEAEAIHAILRDRPAARV